MSAVKRFLVALTWRTFTPPPEKTEQPPSFLAEITLPPPFTERKSRLPRCFRRPMVVDAVPRQLISAESKSPPFLVRAVTAVTLIATATALRCSESSL